MVILKIHPLSLCYGEEASGKYWCDICETIIDPSSTHALIVGLLYMSSGISHAS